MSTGKAMTTTRIQEGERCVLRLAGDLDAPSSRALAAKVAGEPARQLLLDFFAVASIDDRGLVDLADALRGRPSVGLRGLRDHQLRLLGYLGVESARLASLGPRIPH
jgi:hypothetical protein